ncbi:DUF2268 domain-containing protein [Tenuibacillus multivorans]|uniref:Uncharacterized protein YjaZ n=1 Tax=Tenuibacillus multivorans TaxID=237069 RepID=A0A1H0DCV2_9BACI|nr:DUF2268 domain-containing putative Zn-dependent protease [Tenuibacillus multivorans]GEL76606.1 hypothetical protein TMU01_08410 [Tenuibacillus multivorans]SDN67944.1 Uncharacterized protein YjaZ [Tenuibacillus multivorans]
MPVINTYDWLKNFSNQCEQNRSKNPYLIQLETLCKPIKDHFSSYDIEELHYILLQNGLFEPNEWRHIKKTSRLIQEKNQWKLVQKEFKNLKSKWNGPDIPIFILPVKRAHHKVQRTTLKKGGLAFKEALFLFLSPNLTNHEVKSVLAHEYSHVFRLNHFKLNEAKLTLKDMLVLEGLGEYVVKELYGEEYLAPWINLYSYEQMSDLWDREYSNNLNLLNKEKQHLLLFGIGNHRLPKWIGYNIGYAIVESYQRNQGIKSSKQLLKTSADEIINGSNF